MGAKFIADADLGSRSQCLRLCCETENCDVFVYEEKVSIQCLCLLNKCDLELRKSFGKGTYFVGHISFVNVNSRSIGLLLCDSAGRKL